MKKISPVIFGVFIGIAASVILIYPQHHKTAYGEISLWDEVVTALDTASWKSIFSSDEVSDIYALSYNKLFVAPENEALKEVAKMYGLTIEEAKSAAGGSVIPFYNNPNIQSAQITQENAYRMVDSFIDDYSLLLDMYSLSQDIDATVTPTEIFANGDLSDSGFDLIYDLSVIEEILFMEKSKNLVGENFDLQLDEPYLPTQPIAERENYLVSGSSGATIDALFAPDTMSGGNTSSNDELYEGIIDFGDIDVNVSVLNEDICDTSSDNFTEALNEYNQSIGATPVGRDDAGGGGAVGGGSGDSYSGGEIGDGSGDTNIAAEELLAAPVDDWPKQWCPTISSVPDSGSFTANTFGDAGFSSLGGTLNSLIDQATGAGSALKINGLGAYISVCFDTSFIESTYTSYNPGNSCILCELNAIVENLDETLHHSLIPNKATGNLFESAKCKDAGTLLNFQFIAMSAPVPAPLNDDLIMGDDIFVEFKRFVNRYSPFLILSFENQLSEELQIKNALPNTSYTELLYSINATALQKESEALSKIESYKFANEADDVKGFVQAISTEIELTNNFFASYSTLYEMINEQFPYIEQKESK